MKIAYKKVVLTDWKLKIMYSMLLFWDIRGPVLVLYLVWVFARLSRCCINDEVENSLCPNRNMKILKTSHLIELKSYFSDFLRSKRMTSELFLLSCC